MSHRLRICGSPYGQDETCSNLTGFMVLFCLAGFLFWLKWAIDG